MLRERKRGLTAGAGLKLRRQDAVLAYELKQEGVSLAFIALGLGCSADHLGAVLRRCEADGLYLLD